MKVLITGANGFVGSGFMAAFQRAGYDVIGAVRKPAEGMIAVGEIDDTTDWTEALAGCDAVVHAAARVHQMNETSAEAAALYHRTNVLGTEHLARQAARAGVKRFVFLSSIKAMGEGGFFSREMPCMPEDDYGRSKRDAEEVLLKVAAETGLEVVILRLPLIYGPGVRANFLKLFDLVSRGIPLPLGAVNNARSLLALGNLTDLVIVCVSNANAVGKIYLPSDGAPVSTAGMLRSIAAVLGKPSRLLAVPPAIIRLGASLLGRKAAADRVLGDLQVDSSPLQEELGWTPPLSFEEALRETAAWYLTRSRGK